MGPFAATSMVRDVLDIRYLLIGLDAYTRKDLSRVLNGNEKKYRVRVYGVFWRKNTVIPRGSCQVFLVNHCPLMLQGEETNVTPDKIAGDTMRDLLLRCDEHLKEVIGILGAKRVIGVGAFATKRARQPTG